MIALLAVSSFSCGILDKADVNFDIKLKQDFIVAETASATNVTKSYEAVLDASANADFAKYKNKLKDMKINKITYQVTGYATTLPNAVSFSAGTFSVDGTTLVTQGTTDLKAVNGAAEVEVTSLNPSGVSALVAKLKTDGKATVKASGTLSATPVAFKLTAYYYVTVTANALN